MTKRATVKSIEEYVASFCVVALKNQRIECILQVEHENERLRLQINRYEHNLLSGRDDVGVCSGCFQFYSLDDLDECEVSDCGTFCYNCMDSNNECDRCEKRFCDECFTSCQIEGCHSRICDDCIESYDNCEHFVCEKHNNPCLLCQPK